MQGQQQQQQGQPTQQQQQAQMAVSQAVQQVMQQTQQRGGPTQSNEALTNLAVNYMSAMNAANRGGANAGANPMVNTAGGAAGGAPGFGFNAAGLSYPNMNTMMYMNNLNAMSNMPNLLALQQQRSLQQHGGLYGMDPMLGGGNMNQLESRKSRHIKSPTQLKTLKLFFQTNQRPSKEEIRKLVKDTNLPHQEVTRWFRNERHKEKKSQEAKMEALNGHKIMTPGQMDPVAHQRHLTHAQAIQQQAMHQQRVALQQKRKREDGEEDGSDGDDGFNLPNQHGPQRVQFIQQFIASLSDPNELEAATQTLEAKRVALGVTPNGDPNAPVMTDAAWAVLQTSFGKGGPDEKRRKLADIKSAVPAAAAAANGLDTSMVQGLTSMFSKHPEYLKEVQKNLQPQ